MKGRMNMKIGVLYATRTGHTETIAKAMAEALGIQAVNVKDQPEIKDLDLLFIGSGIYASKFDKELLAYMKAMNPSQAKRIVLFCTSLTGIAVMDIPRDILVRKGFCVEAHEFCCKGKYLIFSRKHPNNSDIEQAQGFAVATRDRIEQELTNG